jgi:propanol-preferring alcohol dehydrogenase
MKAAVVHAFGKPLRIEELPVPIVGTREDLAEAILFSAEGKVRAHLHEARLEDVNGIFSDLRSGHVDGRVVLRLAEAA